MMERESERASYNVAMRDTVILYDTLLYGIELPPLVVHAINRKTEQYYIAEEFKFRVEREKRESERKKIEAEGIASSRRSSARASRIPTCAGAASRRRSSWRNPTIPRW